MLVFGPFELQPERQRLLRDGEPLSLGGRAFDLLLALTRHRDRVLTKGELLDLVWPGLVVEENNLQVQISALRKLLGPQAITTVPGRGYRFTAVIDESATNAEPAAKAVEQTPVAAHRTNLPERLPPLIGREDDLAALRTLIGEHPLVTIIGAGGTGKTLLAQHLLDHQRMARSHGVCWVELAALTDGSALIAAITAALGVPLGAGDANAALIAATAPLKVLLALDNAEHLLSDVAHVVETLLAHAPGVRLVVTSQAPLKLPQEWLYRLDPLGVPAHDLPAAEALTYGAIALFNDRAGAADRRFILTNENVAEVRTLCERLDGSALAIELAAARLPLLGLAKLSTSLDERLHLLTKGSSTAPLRQQTLRAALDWSYRWLGENEQIVFRRLAVTVGSAALPLIEEALTDDLVDRWQVLDALDGLVDRSFVAVVGGTRPRYRLLESPRALAREMLVLSGEEEVLRGRHARAVLTHFTSMGSTPGILSDHVIAELEPDHDNARAALAWALEHDPAAAVAAARALDRSVCSGHFAASSALWVATEACLNDKIPAAARAEWATGASRHWSNDQAEVGRSWARQAVALYRALDDKQGLYLALCAQALSRTASGRDEVDAAVAELRTLEQPEWPASLRSSGAEAELFKAYYEEDWARCETAMRQHYRLTQQAGNSTELAPLTNVADMALIKGDPKEAVRLGRELEKLCLARRQMSQLTFVRQNLLKALLACGDVAAARALTDANWAAAAQGGFLRFWIDALTLLAALEGRLRTAARLRGFADAAYAKNQEKRRIGEFKATEQAVSIARAALGDDTFAALHAQGLAMVEAQIAAIVLATEDSAAI